MQAIETFNLWLGRQVGWFYLGAVVFTFYEVLARYIFNAPTTWAFEVTIFLCASGYMLSGANVTAEEKHIAITSVVEIAGPGARWCMRLVALVVGLFGMAGLIWGSWTSGIRALTIWERTGSAYNSPTPALIKPIITAAGILVLLQLALQLARHLRAGPRGPRTAAPPPA
ncbi:MAG: TRAP transporter small permease [Geminicoccaceae bacterium]|nr:TRAP transporter small permease [Geminicoccaceae bacterium]MCB9969089.1 TRAP transporter small permease [Geminicoccaceae bacterium]HRY27237.1 TRAP transporter small permease [Geminicoccaceae bacterium]